MKKHYVTDSIQMVTRFIRDGKLYAERSENRRDGYRIKESDLYDFIDNYYDGIVPAMAFYEEHVDKLKIEMPCRKVTVNEVKEEKKDKVIDEVGQPAAVPATTEEKKEVTKVNSSLEDKLERLIDILLSKSNLQPTTPIVEKTKKEPKESKRPRGEQHRKKSLEKFITHLKKVVTEKDRSDNGLMKSVYEIYFDEKDKMHKYVNPEFETFECPVTNKRVKEGKFLDLLQESVPIIIEQLKEKSQTVNNASPSNSQLHISTEKA